MCVCVCVCVQGGGGGVARLEFSKLEGRGNHFQVPLSSWAPNLRENSLYFKHVHLCVNFLCLLGLHTLLSDMKWSAD